MKRIINWLVEYWWVVPLFMVLQMFVIIFAMFQIPGGWFENMTFIVWFVAIIVELVLLVLLLCHKKWMRFFISLAILVGIVVFLPALSFLAMSAPDGYAKRHPIPEGMKLNIPLSRTDDLESCCANNQGDTLVCYSDPSSFLQIWNGCQGGIYEYDFYYPQLSAGTIFLRCFEAGKNEPLSAETLEVRSEVDHSVITEFSKVVDKKEFTIYEGEWEEYYAVRVEVWHRDSTSHKETKLMEKLYRMEGWMR